jgi:hypothetical protein
MNGPDGIELHSTVATTTIGYQSPFLRTVSNPAKTGFPGSTKQSWLSVEQPCWRSIENPIQGLSLHGLIWRQWNCHVLNPIYQQAKLVIP